MKKIIIKQAESGQRLDVFLSAAAGITRSQIQKANAKGLILINGKIKSDHYRLKEGDAVEINSESLEKEKIDWKLEIIYKNPDLLVIDKPAGLIVHPPKTNSQGTALSDLLVKEFPEIKDVGEAGRPGIVHRLDKGVSGLMIAARTSEAYNFLKKEFAAGGVKKIYTGLVHGKVPGDRGEINLKIARSTRARRMAARPQSQEGKEATTLYRVKKRFTNYTLLEIEIKTGRTHQIRAHFYALGHAIAGDPLYRAKQAGKTVPERIFLHSTRLGFNDLGRGWLEFDSPLPDDLADFLKKLKPEK